MPQHRTPAVDLDPTEPMTLEAFLTRARPRGRYAKRDAVVFKQYKIHRLFRRIIAKHHDMTGNAVDKSVEGVLDLLMRYEPTITDVPSKYFKKQRSADAIRIERQRQALSHRLSHGHPCELNEQAMREIFPLLKIDARFQLRTAHQGKYTAVFPCGR